MNAVFDVERRMSALIFIRAGERRLLIAVGENQYQLLAAEPAHRITVAHALFYAMREVAQEGVACVMTKLSLIFLK